MDEKIKLSKYADDLINNYNDIFLSNCDKLINYLNSIIKEQLEKISKSNDSIEIYKKLVGWLFKFYPNELKKALETNGFNYDNFKKYMITCFIITFFSNEEKAHLLYESLKEKGIVNKFLLYDDEHYELYTNDYGTITFYNVNNFINANPVLLNEIKKKKISIIDGCHEISELLIRSDSAMLALTGILTNPLEEKIFHSIVLDDEMIIDIPNGIIMSYDDYFKLNDFQVISKYSYNELKIKDSQYKQYDESKTLYPLLRCMLYSLYTNSNKKLVDKKKEGN